MQASGWIRTQYCLTAQEQGLNFQCTVRAAAEIQMYQQVGELAGGGGAGAGHAHLLHLD